MLFDHWLPPKILNETRLKVRIYSERNTLKSISDLQKVDCSPVYNDKNLLCFKTSPDIYKELPKPWLTKELNKTRKTRDKNRKKVNQSIRRKILKKIKKEKWSGKHKRTASKNYSMKNKTTWNKCGNTYSITPLKRPWLYIRIFTTFNICRKKSYSDVKPWPY